MCGSVNDSQHHRHQQGHHSATPFLLASILAPISCQRQNPRSRDSTFPHYLFSPCCHGDTESWLSDPTGSSTIRTHHSSNRDVTLGPTLCYAMRIQKQKISPSPHQPKSLSPESPPAGRSHTSTHPPPSQDLCVSHRGMNPLLPCSHLQGRSPTQNHPRAGPRPPYLASQVRSMEHSTDCLETTLPRAQ